MSKIFRCLPKHALIGLFAVAMVAPDMTAQIAHRPAARQLSGLAPASPFQNNNGLLPPPNQYRGPLFVVNHAWPQSSLGPLQNPPWRQAIAGRRITPQNAGAYVAALKAYVSANARNLIVNYGTWDATKAKWYNEPWLGSEREAIHGTYAAGDFTQDVFPGTGLRAEFTTQVVTYYDERAAYTAYKLWGASAMTPNVQTQNSQFEEGSIIVKAAAFVAECPMKEEGWWDAMNGAQKWPLYLSVAATPGRIGCGGYPTQVRPGYVAQFDIIVKDSASSPETGWVFATLVYDSSAPGNDAWDKMVPLGASWGNDTNVTSPGQPLLQNWINEKAPLYSRQTLGWLGRLSGPNDGALADIAVNGNVIHNAPVSSCMSCHSTAEWDVQKHRMDSFLLPSIPNDVYPYIFFCDAKGAPLPAGTPGPNICSPQQASVAWSHWYQTLPGTQSIDPGTVAMDFDEVFSFKALPLWWKATAPPGTPMPRLMMVPSTLERFNKYNGAPIASGVPPSKK